MGVKLVNYDNKDKESSPYSLMYLVVILAILFLVASVVRSYCHYNDVYSVVYQEDLNWTEYGIDDPYYSDSFVGLMFQSLTPELLQWGFKKSNLNNLSIPTRDIEGQYIISAMYSEDGILKTEGVSIYVNNSDIVYYVYYPAGEEMVYSSSNVRDGTQGTKEGNYFYIPKYGMTYDEYIEYENSIDS